MKKFLSGILSLAMLLSMSTAAMAESGAPDLAQVASYMVSNNLRKRNDVEVRSNSVSLGSAIPLYEIQGGSFVAMDYATYYPVFSGGSCIGMLTAYDIGKSSPSYTFSASFSDELNALVNSGMTQFCFVFQNSGIYLKSEDRVELLFQYPTSETEAATLGASGSIKSKIGSANGDMLEYSNYQSGLQNISLKNTKGLGNMIYVAEISQPRGEGVDGLCWAVTVKAIAEWLTSTDHTIYEIADRMGKDYVHGVLPSEGQEALARLYNVRYPNIKGALSQSDIMYYLDDNKPLYIHADSGVTGGNAHVVTLCGYEKVPIVAYVNITIMDSWVGQYVEIWGSDGTYVFDWGGKATLPWNATVCP